MSIYQKRSRGQVLNLLHSGDTTESEYDFILTVGQSGAVGFYGYGDGAYGSVNPENWGNSSATIKNLVTRASDPFFMFRSNQMQQWNDFKNVILRFFDATGTVETDVSSGFQFVKSEPVYYWHETQSEVKSFFADNVNSTVYVKVIDASLEIINTIEMTVGLYEASSFNAWGYRPESETGEIISGKYHSDNAIEICYLRDYYYGMILQSSVESEYWNGWEYVTATWEFEGGKSHVYAGRLLMHPDQGFYCSGVIDDELNALAQNNIDKTVTITLSQAETPSNVIEIEIGEVEIGTGDIAYGFRARSETGELISGEFPDASPVVAAYVRTDGRTDGYACMVEGAFEYSYWYYLDAISVTWEFEDETSYEFPEPLEHYHNATTGESFYKSDYIDETLIEMMSSRVGQTAKITVTEVEASKLIAHLRWELDEEAKI